MLHHNKDFRFPVPCNRLSVGTSTRTLKTKPHLNVGYRPTIEVFTCNCLSTKSLYQIISMLLKTTMLRASLCRATRRVNASYWAFRATSVHTRDGWNVSELNLKRFQLSMSFSLENCAALLSKYNLFKTGIQAHLLEAMVLHGLLHNRIK